MCPVQSVTDVPVHSLPLADLAVAVAFRGAKRRFGQERGRYETQFRRSWKDTSALADALRIWDCAFRRSALSGVMKRFRQVLLGKCWTSIVRYCCHPD